MVGLWQKGMMEENPTRMTSIEQISLRRYKFSQLLFFRKINDEKFQITRNWNVTRQFHLLVTPLVVKEARVHFNCPDLEGAELQNQAR